MAALDRKDGNRAGAAKKSLGRERSAARAEAWDAYITGAWVPDIDTDEAIADACAGLPDELSVMSRQLLEKHRTAKLRQFAKMTGREYEGTK